MSGDFILSVLSTCFWGSWIWDEGFIEELGTYNPLMDPAEIKIDGEKAAAWIKNGAQPTDTVKSLLKKTGVIQ